MCTYGAAGWCDGVGRALGAAGGGVSGEDGLEHLHAPYVTIYIIYLFLSVVERPLLAIRLHCLPVRLEIVLVILIKIFIYHFCQRVLWNRARSFLVSLG